MVTLVISIYLLQIFLAGVSGHHGPPVISIYLLQIFLAGVSGHHGPHVISIYLLQIVLAGVSGHHGPLVNVQISSRTEHDPVMRLHLSGQEL